MPTYRRRDKHGHEVEAVIARAVGCLQTRDGEAFYIPGDYIVTLENGDQFVGRKRFFELKYELAQPPGNK